MRGGLSNHNLLRFLADLSRNSVVLLEYNNFGAILGAISIMPADALRQDMGPIAGDGWKGQDISNGSPPRGVWRRAR